MNLILTVDYELFGNGSGSLDKCVLQPANRILQVAEQFNAPITFFVEVLEFISLAEYLEDRRAQIQMHQAVLKGHDAQLHLHPQWTNANFDNYGNWTLDASRWRIGDLNKYDVYTMIKQGKQWLESEVGYNIPNYRCYAFRAGGWCIQPSEHIISTLQNLGFLVDSTVAPGQWRIDSGEWSDFRSAPDFSAWRSKDDICRSATSGLWELPITTGDIGKFRHLKSVWTSRREPNKGMAPGCIGSYRNSERKGLDRLFSKAVRLRQLGNAMLDISTLSARDLIHITQQWLHRHANKNDFPVPIVAIAHTKNFSETSAQAMYEYLEWAKYQNIQFSTFDMWLRAVSKYE